MSVKPMKSRYSMLAVIGILALLLCLSWVVKQATAQQNTTAMADEKKGLTSDDKFAMQEIMAGTVELMTVLQNDKDGDNADSLTPFAQFVEQHYHRDFVYQILEEGKDPTILPVAQFVGFFAATAANIVATERLLGLPLFVAYHIDEETETETAIVHNRAWANLIFSHEPTTKNGNFAKLEWTFTRTHPGPWQLLQWDDSPNIFPMTTVERPTSTEDAAVVAELAAQIPDDAVSVRGERTCELFELAIEDGNFVMSAWNNGSLHDCPDDWLAAIDPKHYYVAGPRWRSVDLLFTVDENNQLLIDSGTAVEDAVIAEVPAGLGYEMMFVAKVVLAPVAQIEQRTGLTINSMDDVPAQMRQALLSGTADDTPYSGVEVARQLNTVMVHRAGQNVYTINDGTCSYAMKFYTNQLDSTLTDEVAVAELGTKLTELPTGYTYEVRVFDEDLMVVDTDGLQYVIADELGNSYDRYHCDAAAE